MQLAILITALATFALAIPLTRLAIVLMTNLGLVDRPDGGRKLHQRTVPVAGGLAIWFACISIVPFVFWYLARSNSVFDKVWSQANIGFWLFFLAGTALICLVGLADDAWNLRGRHKFFGQVLACSLVVYGGLEIDQIQLFGQLFPLGIFSIPFTFFWLLGAINAINLVDGMDGMASTISAIIGIALCVMATINGHYTEAIVMAALVGAICGFLMFNLPPAKVFLGDTGSMLIGLVLGAMAVRASLKGPATIALAAPMAIWTLPILDAFMAIVRRRLTGRSILIGDRGHLHHRLTERGFTPSKALALIAVLTAITTAGAVASIIWSTEWIAVFVALAVTAFLIMSRLFGHSEMALIAQQSRSFMYSMVPSRGRTGKYDDQRSKIQGSTEWDVLWDSLLTYAEHCKLNSLSLSVNLPSLHEQFYARWNQRVDDASPQIFHVEIPLSSSVLGTIGSLRASGHAGQESACLWMAEVLEGLEPFELQIQDLLSETAINAGTQTSPIDRREVREFTHTNSDLNEQPGGTARERESVAIAHG